MHIIRKAESFLLLGHIIAIIQLSSLTSSGLSYKCTSYKALFIQKDTKLQNIEGPSTITSGDDSDNRHITSNTAQYRI